MKCACSALLVKKKCSFFSQAIKKCILCCGFSKKVRVTWKGGFLIMMRIAWGACFQILNDMQTYCWKITVKKEMLVTCCIAKADTNVWKALWQACSRSRRFFSRFWIGNRFASSFFALPETGWCLFKRQNAWRICGKRHEKLFAAVCESEQTYFTRRRTACVRSPDRLHKVRIPHWLVL